MSSTLFGIPLLPGYTPFEVLRQNNTYGLSPVNIGTFNRTVKNTCFYPEIVRNIVVSILAIHNVALNILSYTPYYFAGGMFRILVGAGLCAFTLMAGERHAQQGFPIQHWYDESLVTGAAQALRGIIDVCVPGGHEVNAALDGVSFGVDIGCFLQNPYADEQNYPRERVWQNPPLVETLMRINALAMLALWFGSLKPR